MEKADGGNPLDNSGAKTAVIQIPEKSTDFAGRHTQRTQVLSGYTNNLINHDKPYNSNRYTSEP